MLVTEHLERTGSTVAAGILANTHAIATRFVKVMPHDYKRALADLDIERDDHPVSTGGGGFFTAETEEKALMGELGAFLKIPRAEPLERDPAERVLDVREFVRPLPLLELRSQGARCMECGVPFCHHGCPLGNLIPDWNDLVYRDRWREAIDQLHRTNNFPEFTGRLCPAPCEAACVLEIREGDAVTIKQIELSIVDRAWDEGWIVPRPPAQLSGRTVAVIGSGPAGLACAQQLARAGHSVTVLERDESAGGLVRFGVPEFKIEKRLVERRLDQLLAEGVEMRYGVDVGVDVSGDELRAAYDAVVVATGSRVPRDLPVPGRELDGVHFAMDYLYDRARAIADEVGTAGELVGRARAADHRGRKARDRDRRRRHRRRLRRQRAARERGVGDPDRGARGASREAARRPHPVAAVADEAPHLVRAEGGRRPRLRDLDDPPLRLGRRRRADPLGAERRLAAVRSRCPGRRSRGRPSSSSSRWDSSTPSSSCSSSSASSAMLAAMPPRPSFATSVEGVFAAGDARRGQSLVVWAINEGRLCAEQVDRWLAETAA